MTGTTQIQSTAQKAWIVFRFIIFGIGGFVAMWVGLWLLIIAIDNVPGDELLLSPAVALPMTLLGAVMMLYGSGQWRRWHYVWVFLSMPITVSVLIILAKSFPKSEFLDSIWAKPLALIWFAAPMPVSYLLVKKHYSRKDAGRALTAEISADSHHQREHSR